MKKEAMLKLTYPEFTMFCHSCQHEFKLHSTYEEADKTVCPLCQSGDVENLYISFSKDGPGFQSNYSSEALLEGGCAGSCPN